MGFHSISPLSLLLILVIIVVLFGTKRIRSIGKDLGEAVKSFRDGMESNHSEKKSQDEINPQ